MVGVGREVAEPHLRRVGEGQLHQRRRGALRGARAGRLVEVLQPGWADGWVRRVGARVGVHRDLCEVRKMKVALRSVS